MLPIKLWQSLTTHISGSLVLWYAKWCVDYRKSKLNWATVLCCVSASLSWFKGLLLKLFVSSILWCPFGLGQWRRRRYTVKHVRAGNRAHFCNDLSPFKRGLLCFIIIFWQKYSNLDACPTITFSPLPSISIQAGLWLMTHTLSRPS